MFNEGTFMKKSMVLGLAFFIIAAVGVIAMVTKPDVHDSSNSPQLASSNTEKNIVRAPNTVTIDNYKFGPNKIIVKKGTKVTWINRDQDRHNIKPDQDSTGFKTGPLLAKDEEYSVVFDTPGIFNYHCAPHPYMKASVEVIE